jgi:hypothetical protein
VTDFGVCGSGSVCAGGLARRLVSIAASVCLLLAATPRAIAQTAADPTARPTLTAGQQLFYNGDYAESAAVALALRVANPEDLAAYELRTSAIHFQIKRLIGDASDKDKAFKQCGSCAALVTAFREENALGLARARARLKATPGDAEALFFLGKLDLNHVWLFLGTLGRRTAWGEYREARRSMERLLERDPKHVRARVAYAWIEYIVDTRVPFGFQWLLGGGDRKKALSLVRAAAESEADFYTKTEARFALWEMQIREKQIAEAVATARLLAADFPDNRDVTKFLETHGR